MTATPTADELGLTAHRQPAQHAITINPSTAQWGHGFTSICLCGWESDWFPTRDVAGEEGANHVRCEEPGEPVLTADRGVVPFATLHPAWCDVAGHRQYVREVCPTAADAATHSRSGGDAGLDEIRNYVDKRVMRQGGGHWSLEAVQRVDGDPTGKHPAWGVELVELTINEPRERGERITGAKIGMTTGEARVFAAHLLALCDAVDLDGVGGRR